MADPTDKLAAARSRYGKPFAHEVTVDRIKPKSLFLRRLERAQAKEAAKRAPVVPLRRSK